MANNKIYGNDGELEVIKHVPCPNCNKNLMILPPNYPLFDIQCTGCSFRAQVKSSSGRPKSIVRGAGWDIMDKVLKSGYMVPPLFVNFKWVVNGLSRQEIRFYPFIPKNFLKKYTLSETARRANYKMFRYEHLDKIPYFEIYKK